MAKSALTLCSIRGCGANILLYVVQSYSLRCTRLRFALCLILFLPFSLGLWIRCTSHHARAAFNSIFIFIFLLFSIQRCTYTYKQINIRSKTANSPFQMHKQKKKNKKLSSTLDIVVESTITSFYTRYFVSRFRYINGIFSCDCVLCCRLVENEWCIRICAMVDRDRTCGDLNFAVIFGHHHHHKPASQQACTHHVNVNRLCFTLSRYNLLKRWDSTKYRIHTPLNGFGLVHVIRFIFIFLHYCLYVVMLVVIPTYER